MSSAFASSGTFARFELASITIKSDVQGIGASVFLLYTYAV